jgi:cell division protein FtsB
MQVDLGIWDKLAKLIILLLVLAGLMGVGLWYLPLIRQNERMQREILVLDGKVQQEEQRRRLLQEQIKSHDDPQAVERLVRENLTFAQPGETVLRFTPASNAPPRATNGTR